MELYEHEEMVDENSTRPGETKAEKFQRLAVPRMNKVLKAIEGIEKLSARGNYDYTEEQVDKMFDAMQEKINSARTSFKAKEKKDEGGFSF